MIHARNLLSLIGGLRVFKLYGKFQPKTPDSKIRSLISALPTEIKAPILYLKGEDHYVRVVTEKGETLLLMRLRDAISRMGFTDGLKTHRSYWVSRNTFQSVSRTGHRRWLTLVNGAKLPLSDLGYRNIVEAGWLETQDERIVSSPSPQHRPWLFHKRHAFGALAILSAITGATWVDQTSFWNEHSFKTEQNFAENSPNGLAREVLRQGKSALQQDTIAGYLSAIRSFEKALILDPALSEAREKLALAYYNGASRKWLGEREKGQIRVLRRAYEHADYLKRGNVNTPPLVEAHIHIRNGRFEDAVSIAADAFKRQPEDTMVRLTLAAALTSNGESEKAIGLLYDVLNTDSTYPASVLWQMGLALFSQEEFVKSAYFFERALVRSPELDPVPLIAVYGYTGKKSLISPLLETAQSRLRPGYPTTVRTLIRGASYHNQHDVSRLINGLRLAGVS
jgi:hypothetical protein